MDAWCECGNARRAAAQQDEHGAALLLDLPSLSLPSLPSGLEVNGDGVVGARPMQQTPSGVMYVMPVRPCLPLDHDGRTDCLSASSLDPPFLRLSPKTPSLLPTTIRILPFFPLRARSLLVYT